MRSRLFLTTLLIIILNVIAACTPLNNVSIHETQGTAASLAQSNQPQFSQPLPMPPVQGVTDRPRCAAATAANERECARIARQILASTVRYVISGLDSTGQEQLLNKVGHGTVVDGRYLVVHNHFSVDLTLFADERYAEMATISMYTGIGDLFVWEAKPPMFKVSAADRETLLLDFGTDSTGEGFFESRGLQSASSANWQQSLPRAGQEVAQVTWDYPRTSVNWVLVKEVMTLDGVPRLILSSQLLPGASGGGVFWNGDHIAVNWQTSRILSEENEVLEQFSTVALNSNPNG